MEQVNTAGTYPREGESRSVVHLLKHLASETEALIRSEVELVRAEVNEKVSQAQSGVVSMATGAVVAFSGLIILLMAVAFFINTFLGTAWISFLIVGGVTALIGVAMLSKGRSDVKPKNLAPTRTADALHDDKKMAERHLNTTPSERREGHDGRANA